MRKNKRYEGTCIVYIYGACKIYGVQWLYHAISESLLWSHGGLVRVVYYP